MKWLAVGAGGFIGTLGRYALEKNWPAAHGFPWGTLLVNGIGCFAFGLLTGLWAARGAVSAYWRLALGPGLIGGFTTFSAFAVETVRLMPSGWAEAALYVTASVIGGAALSAAGYRIVHRLHAGTRKSRKRADSPAVAGQGRANDNREHANGRGGRL